MQLRVGGGAREGKQEKHDPKIRLMLREKHLSVSSVQFRIQPQIPGNLEWPSPIPVHLYKCLYKSRFLEAQPNFSSQAELSATHSPPSEYLSSYTATMTYVYSTWL